MTTESKGILRAWTYDGRHAPTVPVGFAETAKPSVRTWVPMLAAILLVQASLATSLLAADTYLSVLGGEQIFGAAPPTAGYGYAILTLNELDMLCYSITATQLSGGEMATELWAHQADSGGFTPLLSVAAQRSLVASPTTGCVGPLTPAEKTSLERGDLHVTIRTDAFPEGELQGRVVGMIGESRSGEAPDAFGLEGSDWQTIAALVELEDDQWLLLERLLKLTPDGWHLLKQVLADGGGVYLGEDGEVSVASAESQGLASRAISGQPVPGPMLDAISLNDLNDKLNSIQSTLNTVNSRTSSILSVVNTVNSRTSSINDVVNTVSGRTSSIQDVVNTVSAMSSSILGGVDVVKGDTLDLRGRVDDMLTRIPDRPDVRSLIDEVDLSQVRGLLETVGDEISGVVDTVRFIREGFDQFAPGGACSVDTECDRFKQRINRLFDDLEQAWDVSQRLLCFENPEILILPLRTEFFRTLLDKAPPVLLYATMRVLDQFDGWDTMLAETIAAIPPELTVCGVAQEVKCSVVTAPATRFAVKRTKNLATLQGRHLRKLKKALPDAKVVGLGATVGAGGGGTVSIQNHAKKVFEEAHDALEELEEALEKFERLADTCEEARFRDEVLSALKILTDKECPAP